MFLSPELKNVRLSELRPAPPSFHRHVVVPQFPLDMAIYAAPLRRSWERPYTFCFRGTQVTQQRTTLAQVMLSRNDSYLDANCRRSRQQATTAMKTEASVELYSRCKFCPVPKGDSLSDRRFFDVMRSGCLPVTFERLKPLPYAQWLNYTSWALLQEDHTARGMAHGLDRLAAMPAQEWYTRQQSMLATTRALSIAGCQGHTGLYYMLASLGSARAGERALDDILGYNGVTGWVTG